MNLVQGRARGLSGSARRMELSAALLAALLGGVLAWLLWSGGAAADGWPVLGVRKLSAGLDLPVHVTHAGDGSGRLFVVEQPGRIRLIKDGVLSSEPFLNITHRVQSGGEMGLLSVAFPPGYAQKGYFYVNYTEATDDPDRPRTVIARYFVGDDPDRADYSREQRILTIDQPTPSHNGGQLAFGPDGYLYIGTGDGGFGNDPDNQAQRSDTLLGKILRIDVETAHAEKLAAPGDGGLPYHIPADNPFVARTDSRPEVWALGLRNPWRFSFDRLTGDLYIGDVGQNLYEEINVQPGTSRGGENYGWRVREGAHCNSDVAASCSGDGLADPVVEFDRSDDHAMIGGFVYRGAQYPALQGIYVYGDYLNGRLRGLRREGDSWVARRLLEIDFKVTSFGEDEAGELYVLDYLGGGIYQLTSR